MRVNFASILKKYQGKEKILSPVASTAISIIALFLSVASIAVSIWGIRKQSAIAQKALDNQLLHSSAEFSEMEHLSGSSYRIRNTSGENIWLKAVQPDPEEFDRQLICPVEPPFLVSKDDSFQVQIARDYGGSLTKLKLEWRYEKEADVVTHETVRNVPQYRRVQ